MWGLAGRIVLHKDVLTERFVNHEIFGGELNDLLTVVLVSGREITVAAISALFWLKAKTGVLAQVVYPCDTCEPLSTLNIITTCWDGVFLSCTDRLAVLPALLSERPGRTSQNYF